VEHWSDSRRLRETSGAPAAFDVFYRRHERLVLTYFMRRTADPELAADLCAETFAAALLAAGRYRSRGDDSAAAWLLGIGRHRLLRSLRRGQVDDGARRRLAMAPVVLDDQIAARLEQIASDDRVAELLGRLPAEQAEAIRARVIEERSYPEISSRLRCSEAVVRKRVSRGLASLRDLTKGHP